MAATFHKSNQQILDSSGDPIVGAKLESYASGTSAPLACYSDEALTTAIANPASGATTGNQVTGSDGYLGSIYLQALAYKFILKDSAGATVWSHDAYNPDGGSAAIGEVPDSSLRVVDNVDATKKIAFEASGITTGNTRTMTIPDFDGTLATLAGTETLTNKTIDSSTNTLTLDLSEGTLTGTTAEFNTALSDGSFATLAGTETLTNKTIDSATNTLTLDLSEGTLTGTTAEFNTALSDGSFATLAGTETLTNKTLTAPVINGAITGTAFDNNIRTLRSYSCVGDGTTDDSANFLTAFNDAKLNGYKLRGEGLTYRLTSAFAPTFASGDAVDLDDMEIFIDESVGSEIYSFYLNAGDLETSIPVTSDVARAAASVEVAGGTKPVAGDFYYLLSDEAGDYADVLDTIKGAMVQVSPAYDGVSATVPLSSETPFSLLAASNARLRRTPGQDISVRIGQDNNNFTLKGPGGTANTNGLVTRNLVNSAINVRRIYQFYKRGMMDIGSYAPYHVADRVENTAYAGIAYAVISVATQGGVTWVKSTGLCGSVYTTGSAVINTESIPSRHVHMPHAYYDGCFRSVLDAHPGGFYPIFGGASGTTFTSEDPSEDGITMTGSNPVFYGPLRVVGGGHRHLIAYSPYGCTDDPNYIETFVALAVSGDTEKYGLVVSQAGGATLTRPVHVSIQSLSTTSGESGVELQPEDSDMTVVIGHLASRSSAGEGVRVNSKKAAGGRGFLTIAHADIETIGNPCVEFDGLTYGATGAGMISIHSGRVSRQDGGGTYHLDADYGAIHIGEGVLIDGTSDDSTTSNGGTVSLGYQPGAVAITGGSINATTVGSTTPAAGAFTSLNITDNSIDFSGAEWISNNATDNVAIARTRIASGAGANNLSIGNASGGTSYTATAQDNVCLGVTAGQDITDGVRNICVGVSAGLNVTTGGNNILLGYSAAPALLTGSNNFGLGSNALTALVSGSGNIALGPSAMTAYLGSNCVAIGNTAVRYPTGTHNVGIGLSALAGVSGTNTSAQNTAIGSQALAVIGNPGSSNVAVGYNAGVSATTANQNVFVGALAGDATTTGDNNIVIGYNVDTSSAGASNEIVVGNASHTVLQLPAGVSVKNGTLQVLGARQTGWTAPTGTPTRTGYVTSTATTTQLAETLKALIDDLVTHGVIGT